MAEERRPEPESGLDGILCPICGQVVERLPISIRRVVNGYAERLHVCSPACRAAALRSPHVQMSLFGSDPDVWTKSVQGEPPSAAGGNGTLHDGDDDGSSPAPETGANE